MFRSLPSDWRDAGPVAVDEQSEAPQEVVQICSTPSPCDSPHQHDAPNGALLPEAGPPTVSEPTTSRCSPANQACSEPLLTLLPPPASPCGVAMLKEGTEVEIDGLIARPDFNGSFGIVQSWDPVLRRYNVLLDHRPGCAGPRQHVKAKRENLRVRPPPPPASAAAILSTTIDLAACIPLGPEEVAVLDGDQCQSPESPAWFSWQQSDAGSWPNPEGEAAMQQFGSPGATWDFGSQSSPSDLAASFEDQAFPWLPSIDLNDLPFEQNRW